MNARINPSQTRSRNSCGDAFTFVELLVVLGVIAICAIMAFPAIGRTKTNSSMLQCQNNLKQLVAAWTMYSAENNGRLVSAYPNFGGFTGTWCAGNASSFGPESYQYDGADPRGITSGLLWPYIKSLSPYKCPADKRISTGLISDIGKPILRSVSMNSYMAGTSFGVTPSWNPNNPSGPRNANTPVFFAESEISRPSSIFVILDEDPRSINDGMFIVDMGGTRGFLDLPSRLHGGGYGINFADGHVENIKLNDHSSLVWTPGAITINNDWRRLTNLTAAPLN